MLAAQRGDLLEKTRRLLAHAGCALHRRLQNDARRFRGLFFEKGFQGRDAGRVVRFPDCTRMLMTLGRREMVGGKKPWLEPGVESTRISDSHCAKSIAVIGIGHTDHPTLLREAAELPVLEGHLQGDLDGVGAVVAEEATIQCARSDCRQFPGQLGANRVAEPEIGRVGDLFHLGGKGGIEVRVVVTMDVCPNGSVAIQVAAPVGISQPDARAAFDVNRLNRGVFLHLRKRVPGMGEIPFTKPLIRRFQVRPHNCPFMEAQSTRIVKAKKKSP
jgi:hypothetical protein